MTRLLSLAHLTAIDLPPPDLVRLAAATGFDAVGLRLIRVTDTSPGYPLMHDPAMMRATLAAMAETGIAVHDIEFVKLEPDTDIAALEPFLDAGAELGAREVIAAPYDPDLGRLAERLGDLSLRAGTRGLKVSMEFFPWTDVPDLDAALAVVERAGPEVGILVDCLHFDRSGSRIESLRKVPRSRLRFAHLCDAAVHPPYTTEALLHTARAERIPPGEGQIDLVAILMALPPDLPLGIEVPMDGLTREVGACAVARRVMAATRRLLARLDSADSPPQAVPEE